VEEVAFIAVTPKQLAFLEEDSTVSLYSWLAAILAPASECSLTKVKMKKNGQKQYNYYIYVTIGLCNILKMPGYIVCSEKKTGPTQRKRNQSENLYHFYFSFLQVPFFTTLAVAGWVLLCL
jgi:hypothetical protein